MIPGIAPAIITRTGDSGGDLGLIDAYMTILTGSSTLVVDLTPLKPVAETGDLILIHVSLMSITTSSVAFPAGWNDLVLHGAVGGNRSAYVGGGWQVLSGPVPDGVSLSITGYSSVATVMLFRGYEVAGDDGTYTTSYPVATELPAYAPGRMVVVTACYSATSGTAPLASIDIAPLGDAYHDRIDGYFIEGSRPGSAGTSIYSEWDLNDEVTIDLDRAQSNMRVAYSMITLDQK